MRYLLRHLATSTIIAGATFAFPALAQDAPVADTNTTTGIEDIIVTAQKREESLQKVPVTVTAIGGAALEARGLTSIVQLEGSVPGLQIQEFSGVLMPFLRGVGNSGNALGNEASVAVYSDGVYFARLPSAMFELNNIERVEVLKGPQGTLFGRNSTGGVINVITKDPSHDTMVKGSIGYGRFDAFQANLYATTGLSDSAAIDLSVSGQTDDGFGRNITTGNRYGYEDSFLIRSKLLFEPSDSTKLSLTGFYSWARQSGQKAAFPGTATGTITAPPQAFFSEVFGYYNAISDIDLRHTFKTWGLSLRAEQELPFARFTSISAYSKVSEVDAFDGDYGPRPDQAVPIRGYVKLFTQEFQLTNLPDSPFDWIIGAYYYNNFTNYYSVQFIAPSLFGPGIDAPARQKALSYAGFAQASYEIVPRLTLTGGIRYTSDKTAAFGVLNLKTTPATPLSTLPRSSTTINKVTFKAAADFQVTDQALLYASFSRGFKSGNYNILTYNSTDPTKPEVIDAYEAGFKTDLFDRRLRFNGAAFWYDIGSPQVQLIRNSTVFYSNAGASRIKGAEIEGQAVLLPGFTTRFNAQYLDAKYRRYVDAPASIPDLVNGGAIGLPNIDARGNRTPHASKWTFGLGGDYVIETAQGSITITADYYHNSGYFYEPDNFLRQKAYDLLSGQIKYAPTENLAFRIWGKNLTDTRYTISAATQAGPGGYPWTPAPPRTYGIAVDFKF
jgi:iron complex outermembrane receptor protein